MVLNIIITFMRFVTSMNYMLQGIGGVGDPPKFILMINLSEGCFLLTNTIKIKI